MNTGSSVYPLLSTDGTAAVRQRLAAEHQHFYHFTLDCYRLASIKKRGLDPWYESDESGYARRNREPGKAIRYCTKQSCGVKVGLSTANVRARDCRTDLRSAANVQVVLLRTKATYLLDRSFGLDHSFGDIDVAVDVKLEESKQPQLTADQFIQLVTQFGVISCYQIIRPDELEICMDDIATFCKSLNGQFAPLLANP
jgi:hypothetical protein